VKRTLLLILLIAGVCLPLSAQTAAQIGAIFADLSPDAPGAAVLVLRNGKTVFQHGYGVADLRTKRRIDAKTDFRLASFTKQFTAMSIMLLVHDGKLRYDEPLTEVFPDFPAYGKNITIANLLSHTSGLVAYEDVMDKQYAGTPDEQIPQIKDAGVLAIMEQQTATKFPPGSAWQYSNSGYAVLAMVVEKASGQPYGDFLRQRIFKPLGMKHTLAYEQGKNEVPRRAFGHGPVKDGTGWRETDQSSTSAVLGDGGIYTNLDDLKKWVKALDRYRLLNAEEMKPAYTPVVVPRKAADIKAMEDGKSEYQEPWNRPNPTYGYGWFLDPFKGHRRIFHDGSTIGGKTSIMRLPDDGLTVIVLSNRGNFDPGKRAEKILELFIKPQIAGGSATSQNIPADLIGRWRIAREIATRTISCWGIEEAKKIIGTTIEYTSDSLRWKDRLISHPAVEVATVSAQEFHDAHSGQGFDSSQVALPMLGIKDPVVTQVTVAHRPAEITGSTTEIPGDEVLLKSPNTIVFAVCNYYFEAVRMPSSAR
jgi:CubicO group peptidase (beta-lactamase class C family)